MTDVTYNNATSKQVLMIQVTNPLDCKDIKRTARQTFPSAQ